MLEIRIKADISGLKRDIDRFLRKQLPFATALALTDIAKRGAEEERKAMVAQLDKPTPFTQRGIGVRGATKALPVATIFIKDIQAQYLTPEILGGRQVLGRSRAILKPVDQRVNQYGNLPRGLIGRLKGRPDIFIGKVTTKNGQSITGVWQRVNITRAGKVRRRHIRGTIFSKEHGALRLLVRIGDAAQVKVRYRWGDATLRVVASNYVGDAFDRALSRAMATAR
jgi:hypothetical protein